MAYRLIEKQVIYSGKRVRLEVHHLEDDEGGRQQREIVVHPGAVVVLPLLNIQKGGRDAGSLGSAADTPTTLNPTRLRAVADSARFSRSTGRGSTGENRETAIGNGHGDVTILLIRNRRYALNQILLELPAGTLEKGEDPMNCAGRELLEETGHLAGRLRAMGSFFTSPGILSEKIYAFIAYDLEKSKQSLDEGEEIEVVQHTLDEAIEMIGDGRIQDGKTIATLLMYERFHRAGDGGGGGGQ